MLTSTIQEVIVKTIPKVKLSPYTMQWWSWELAQCWADIRRLAQRAHKRGVDLHDPTHQEHKILRDSYSVMIETLRNLNGRISYRI